MLHSYVHHSFVKNLLTAKNIYRVPKLWYALFWELGSRVNDRNKLLLTVQRGKKTITTSSSR